MSLYFKVGLALGGWVAVQETNPKFSSAYEIKLQGSLNPDPGNLFLNSPLNYRKQSLFQLKAKRTLSERLCKNVDIFIIYIIYS